MADSWLLVSASEERLLLHQFLRFGETRAIAQHLILQQALQMLTVLHSRPHPAPPNVDCSQPQPNRGVLGSLRQPFHCHNHTSPLNTSLLSSYGWFLPRDEKARDLEEDG